MIKTTMLLGLAALFLPLCPAPAHAQDACTNLQFQIEMNACARHRFEEADRDLNIAYAAMLAMAKRQDIDIARISPAWAGAEGALRKAQRAWIDYRDGHCEGMGMAARGGSMEPMLVWICKEGLTATRTSELREMLDEMDG